MKKELISTVVKSIKDLGYVNQSNGDLVQYDDTFNWRTKGYRFMYGEVPGLNVNYERVPELGSDIAIDVKTYMKDDVFYVTVYAYGFGKYNDFDHDSNPIGFGVYSYSMDSEFGKYYTKYKAEEDVKMKDFTKRVDSANSLIRDLQIPEGWTVSPDCKYGTYIKVQIPEIYDVMSVDFTSVKDVQGLINEFHEFVLKYPSIDFVDYDSE